MVIVPIQGTKINSINGAGLNRFGRREFHSMIFPVHLAQTFS